MGLRSSGVAQHQHPSVLQWDLDYNLHEGHCLRPLDHGPVPVWELNSMLQLHQSFHTAFNRKDTTAFFISAKEKLND